jgi:hypothetical protein
MVPAANSATIFTINRMNYGVYTFAIGELSIDMPINGSLFLYMSSTHGRLN